MDSVALIVPRSKYINVNVVWIPAPSNDLGGPTYENVPDFVAPYLYVAKAMLDSG